MDLEVFRLAADSYHHLLNAELHINEWVQEHLSLAEPLFRFISVYLEPGTLFNVLIPLMGILSQGLLTQLLYMITVVSTVSSLEKWIYPELRPLWWLRELYANGNRNAIRSGIALQSHDLSCETSGGLPCAHSMSLMAFLVILSSHLSLSSGCRNRKVLLYSIVGCCMISVWLSRLYLATEFLHQCLLGSYIAISTLSNIDRHSDYLRSRRRIHLVAIVLLLGSLATAVYFIKLRLGFDPHWSVRQAFKWCPEPTYMRHEGSPIFLLTRDLGNLMGVALSVPLELKPRKSSLSRRFGGILIVEIFNHILRLYTPKQHGRFAFLAFEFSRNALHSLTLIKILPKLIKEKVA
ncbi:glucose-6-phosphatase catalytic subunit 1 [Drosophila albomicans]|uniref:glucose-6-phosphatase n=1 Tax=Drosophila albomicans TaxID=7291 RepID=A0A6P8WJR8_DROAB|nr:glucose-6-phosphatase catalytic subunit 1 [Drosophila albomicans]